MKMIAKWSFNMHIKEPPKTPSKTHLGARTRPDPQNDSKMEPPTPQNGAPDPLFWIDFGANFGDF